MRASPLDNPFAVPSPATARDGRNPNTARLFVEHLEQKGLLDRMTGERAISVQAQTGERIDHVLSQLGLISDQALLEASADFLQTPLVVLSELPPDICSPELLDAEFVRRNRIVPLTAQGGQIALAVSDPFANDLADAVSYLLERPVRLLLASATDIDAALSRLYGSHDDTGNSSSSLSEASHVTAYQDDIQHLRDMASEAPIIRLVHRLISSAVSQQASDIHVEPHADSVRVRYRIDGLMHEAERFPPEAQAGVATRIKILGKLNIAERRLPQDGRATFVFGGREIDLRISTTPVLHGESIVLRILDSEQIELTFDALGFDQSTQQALRSLLRQPNGVLLVTGPTGSGKTTTLYSALHQLNTSDRTIFSVEDPIEYQLAGINQMQIKPAIGLDFVTCLRSILRQDPDIIMIGEMRDPETASTAIRAALTGHLVLSTLHTNSAAASVTRLLDMGVEDFLLASSLSGILAQRLVRRLCPDCAVPTPETQYRHLVDGLHSHREAVPQNPKSPVGCAACRGIGFRGRTTVSELLVIDDEIRRIVKRGISDRDIESLAVSKGMQPLYQSGIRKVLAGETTLEEILRVTRF